MCVFCYRGCFTLTHLAETWGGASLPQTLHSGNPLVHEPWKKWVSNLRKSPVSWEFMPSSFSSLPLKLKHLVLPQHSWLDAVHHHRVLESTKESQESEALKQQKLIRRSCLTSLMAVITRSNDAGLKEQSREWPCFSKSHTSLVSSDDSLLTWILRKRIGHDQRAELDAPCSEPWCSLLTPAEGVKEKASFPVKYPDMDGR